MKTLLSDHFIKKQWPNGLSTGLSIAKFPFSVEVTPKMFPKMIERSFSVIFQ